MKNIFVALILGSFTLAMAQPYEQASKTDYESDRYDEKKASDEVQSQADNISKNIYETLYGYISDGNQNISFEFNEGELTLTGYVHSQEEKDKIERDLKKINGIKKINNKIQVSDSKKMAYYQPQTADNNSTVRSSTKTKDYGALDNDKKINAKIREKLDSRGFVDVAIITANGVVTLGGTVNNSGEFEPFVMEIEKIEGVKKVNNKVTSKK